MFKHLKEHFFRHSIIIFNRNKYFNPFTQFEDPSIFAEMPRSRGDVNFRSLFQDFNASKFIIFTSLLIFSLLYALKLDGVLNWSWWSIFVPIWIWKGIVGEYGKIKHAKYVYIYNIFMCIS